MDLKINPEQLQQLSFEDFLNLVNKLFGSGNNIDSTEQQQYNHQIKLDNHQHFKDFLGVKHEVQDHKLFSEQSQQHNDSISKQFSECNYKDLQEKYHQITFNINNFEQSQIIAKYLANLATVSVGSCNQQDGISSTLIEVAINELLINAIEHGMLNINYDVKTKLLAENQWEQYIHTALSAINPEQVVTICLKQKSASANQIQIMVSDPGKGFDVAKFGANLINNSTAQHGRGHMLISMLKELQYHGKSNIVSFVVDYSPGR